MSYVFIIAMVMPISTLRCVPLGEGILGCQEQYMERLCLCVNDTFLAGQGGHSGSIKLSEWIGDRAVGTRDLE